MSFVLHPNQVPAALQLAQLGTRYMLALVEIGDDEKPINRKEALDIPIGPATPAPSADNATARAPRKPVSPDGHRTRIAAILCADPVFQTYLFEHDMIPEKSKERAAVAVRLICHVDSRSDIIPGTPAADAWDDLYSKFMAWKIAA